MDWGQLAANWTEKAKAALSDVSDAALSKIEEAKFLSQPPITVGSHKVGDIRCRHFFVRINYGFDIRVAGYESQEASRGRIQ
jgi:hypothetical protein